MSRRDALGVAGKGAGLLSMAALLASCGIAGSAERRGAPVDWAAFWKDQKPTKQLNFANWPLYIDSEHGKTDSLELFTKATGIKVAYDPVIQSDDSFYATVEPELAAQEVTGYDIMVITNGWYFTQLVNNGFLNELDFSKMPNFFKYASPLVKNPQLRPRQQALGDVADRLHRHRLQHQDDQARDHELQRPRRPGLQRARRHVERQRRTR